MKRDIYRSYEEKLKDPEWRGFVERVMSQPRIMAGDPPRPTCEACCSTEELEVHHLGYMPNREPWEYSFDEVMVLCRSCHHHIHCAADDIWNTILRCRSKDRSTHLKLIRSHRIVEWLENDFKKRAVFVPEYNTGPNILSIRSSIYFVGWLICMAEDHFKTAALLGGLWSMVLFRQLCDDELRQWVAKKRKERKDAQ